MIIQHEGCKGKETQMLRRMLTIVLLLAIVLSTQIFAEDAEVKEFQTKLINKNITGGEYIFYNGTAGGTYLGSSHNRAEQMGETIYDYQHNGSMGRQVTYDIDNGIVHFDWMWDNLAGEGRAIKYNAYDGTDFEHGSGATGGLAVSGENGGYCNIDLASNGRGLISHHEGVNSDVYKPYAGFDILPPSGAYTFYGAPSPSADDVINCEEWETGNYEYESAYIWPKVEFDICDGTDVVHMVATESPPEGAANDEIQTIVYYRGTANATTGAITWPSCPMAIDSV